MSKKVIIRPVQDDDIQAIVDIYDYYVNNSCVTFEWTPPSLQEMNERVHHIQSQGYPYLVLEEAGQVIGYAYVSPYRSRKGWSWCVEDSIYLKHGHDGHGYGSMLLEALIVECKKINIRMMVAVISANENIASIRLHQKMGFRMVGTMIDVGYKFNEWQNVVFMQKDMGIPTKL
ncbi:MAG: GNAT family N-acetyltransferase [Alphaproteobacteria bacterium]